MAPKHMKCPSCGVQLSVPADAAGKVARCPHCKERFRLPEEPKVTGEEVASWLSPTGGNDDDDLDSAGVREQTRKSPWDYLPPDVQQRIEAWYHPEKQERFVAFVPDRGQPGQAEGKAGIVVTNQRLIHHTRLSHKEVPVSEPLRLKLYMVGDAGELSIDSASLRLKQFRLDADGARRLRFALTLARFRMWWN